MNLTDYEINSLIPAVKRGIETKTAKNPITAKKMVAGLRKFGYVCDDKKLRKIINYLRCNPWNPGWNIVSSTKCGYWYTNKKKELKMQADSYSERIGAMQAPLRKLRQQLKEPVHGN